MGIGEIEVKRMAEHVKCSKLQERHAGNIGKAENWHVFCSKIEEMHAGAGACWGQEENKKKGMP